MKVPGGSVSACGMELANDDLAACGVELSDGGVALVGRMVRSRKGAGDCTMKGGCS